jgi:heme exporter protein B
MRLSLPAKPQTSATVTSPASSPLTSPVDSSALANSKHVLPAGEPSVVNMLPRRGIRGYWAKVWAVAWKDLRAEVRAKEVFGAMTAFGVLAVVVFGMAFDLRVPQPAMVVPGVLWVVLLFAGVLGLHRSFGAEMDRQTLPALLLAPVDRSAVYFGKFLAQLLFLLATCVIILPIIVVIFDVNILNGWILTGLALGIIGYVAVGVLFGALTASTRARESMLPILLLPVMAPVFMAGIGLTANVLDGRTFTDFRHWLLLLVIYDTVFLTVAYLIFDLIWEDI